MESVLVKKWHLTKKMSLSGKDSASFDEIEFHKMCFCCSPPYCLYDGAPYICSGLGYDPKCHIYVKEKNEWQGFGALTMGNMLPTMSVCFPSGKLLIVGG